MAFLAKCPDCGKFQICVLDVEDAINLKCQGCGGIFTPVSDPVPAQDNVNWSLATTMAGYEYEPPRRSTENLVVITNLPSIYPNQRPPRRYKPKRPRKRRTPRIEESQSTPVPTPPPPETFPLEPAPPDPTVAPTDEAIADPTAPKSEPDALVWSTSSTANLYRLPPPEGFVRPAKRKVEEEFEDYGKLELNRTSIIALFTLVVGLLLAALTSISYLPLILIAASVVLGIFAIRSSLNEGRRLLVPGATLSVAAVVLIASIAAPGLMSSGRSRGKPPTWANELLVVPHPKFAGDPDVRTAEWIDAGKASVQLGAARLEIIEARVGKPPGGGANSFLLVRFRVYQNAAVPGIPGGSSNPKELNGAVLFAAAERFEQLGAFTDSGTGGAAGSNGRPGINYSDTLLAFPVAAANASGLRLEIPSAAIGGSRPIRFAISSAMIKR